MLVVFAFVGIAWAVYSSHRRRENYKSFKTYMKTIYEDTLEADAMEADLQKKNPKGKMSTKNWNDMIAKKLKKRIKKSRHEIRRMFGAGTWHGWLPNPREWWESHKNRRRLKKQFGTLYEQFPSGVRSFAGDLSWDVARSVLRHVTKERREAEKDAMRKIEGKSIYCGSSIGCPMLKPILYFT
jgi:hypothetical protein